MKTMEMKVVDLIPHPKNEEIYGYNEDVSDLVDKIQKSKQVHTLTVNSKGVVLAGHRRRKACMELGIKTVNVEVVDFDTPEEEIEFIVLNNHQRNKTNEQKAKEAKALKEVESKLADIRRRSTQNNNTAKKLAEVPNSAHQSGKGKSRDIVAKNVGLRSGHEVDRAINAVNKIDILKEEGRVEDAELIRGVLNNGSISAADELAKNIDIVVIPEEDKPLIKSGKKSSYSYVEQAKQKQKPTIETKICKTCGKELQLDMFRTGRNECKNCCSEKDRNRRSGIFKDTLRNVMTYDKSIVNSKEMEDAIAFMKRDDSEYSQGGIDYGMEFEYFKITLDNYYFANEKFINGDIFSDMPKNVKKQFSDEIDKLSGYIELLKSHL